MSYTFTIRAIDANGKSGLKQYTINVLNTANDPIFTLANSLITSNNAFFLEYEEDIINSPVFVVDSSVIISNNNFFLAFEEDIVNNPTFTLTGSSISGPTL